MNKELKTVIGHKKVRIKGIEGNYLICNIVWNELTTKVIIKGKGKKSKIVTKIFFL